MKRLTFVFMLVLLGAMPVDAYVLKEEVVERSRDVEFAQLPSIIILHDSEMKRKVEVGSITEIMTITEGIYGAARVDGLWTKGEKLGTLDFGDEELYHIYYGMERKTVYVQADEETWSMSRTAFFELFYPSIHSRQLPPGANGDAQPLPPGRDVQPDDLLPL
ncbi:hypothetical protein LC065_18245 [Halobacillus litoralis]|uniref:hypothetical protein n=1 Tax=Halobacillus litoralis TaxID=45668 RepID=UPI001CFD1CA8|nr:hypothetical protein [Halobacillus litoralis]WLR47429.1 hypothetical protein LC065_18245 [Halobacillus litoralis]